jgi:hypothetical protein
MSAWKPVAGYEVPEGALLASSLLLLDYCYYLCMYTVHISDMAAALVNLRHMAHGHHATR